VLCPPAQEVFAEQVSVFQDSPVAWQKTTSWDINFKSESRE